MKLAILVSAFLILQVAAILHYRRLLPFRGRNAGLPNLMLLESLVLISFVAGAYAEARFNAVTRVADLLERRAPQLPQIPGDPPYASLRPLLQEQRPRFVPPDAVQNDDFVRWQADVRQWLRDETFQVPDISVAEHVSYEIHQSTVLTSGVRRLFLSYESFDGARIPGFLFVPPNAHAEPAIVVVPGHVMDWESGIAQTAGLEESYQHGAALQLANHGFITLTTGLRGFGLLGPPASSEHNVIYNALLAGSFYKAVIVKDLKRAVDVLQSRPEVDAGRIGITGVSFGGELSVVYAALDTRIKVAVFQGYSGSVGPDLGLSGPAGHKHHYCHVIPGINTVLSSEDLFLLIAPRPTLGLLGDQEGWTHSPSLLETMKATWSALGRSGSVDLRIVPGGHEFFVAPTVEFFRHHLAGDEAP